MLAAFAPKRTTQRMAHGNLQLRHALFAAGDLDWSNKHFRRPRLLRVLKSRLADESSLRPVAEQQNFGILSAVGQRAVLEVV